ncbi:MAG: SPFH domain-containing protein [Fimbriimonadales bacterium]
MVPAGHRAVKMQVGAVVEELSEGIHLIVPFVNSTELVEVRTQIEESQASAASRDLADCHDGAGSELSRRPEQGGRSLRERWPRI